MKKGKGKEREERKKKQESGVRRKGKKERKGERRGGKMKRTRRKKKRTRREKREWRRKKERREEMGTPGPTLTHFFTLASPLGMRLSFFFLRILTALRHSVSESSTSFTFP